MRIHRRRLNIHILVQAGITFCWFIGTLVGLVGGLVVCTIPGIIAAQFLLSKVGQPWDSRQLIAAGFVAAYFVFIPFIFVMLRKERKEKEKRNYSAKGGRVA